MNGCGQKSASTTSWEYGIVGFGKRDRKTLDSHRRKGQAICYRQRGDRCDVWQYNTRTWIPIPERSIDFVALCEMVGENAPGNRRIATRNAGLGCLTEAENHPLMLSPMDAAYRLHRSPSRIYRWIQAGCPAYAVIVAGQRRIRVRLDEVQQWAEMQGYLT